MTDKLNTPNSTNSPRASEIKRRQNTALMVILGVGLALLAVGYLALSGRSAPTHAAHADKTVQFATPLNNQEIFSPSLEQFQHQV